MGVPPPGGKFKWNSPYHMHIFDICKNDLQNKNFLAEKL